MTEKVVLEFSNEEAIKLRQFQSKTHSLNHTLEQFLEQWVVDHVFAEIEDQSRQSGYHISPIPRGEYGKPSKIVEEAAEFEDAISQGCSIMALLELADLYGAIRGYLKTYHPTLSMHDLEAMSNVTQRAFQNGHRNERS